MSNSHLHEFNISGVKYADPDPDLADELPHVDQKNVVLVEALGLDARCFDYVYDFGDSWHHVVVTAIADSDHEDHDRFLHWLGGQFDPRQFDLDATNQALSKIKA